MDTIPVSERKDKRGQMIRASKKQSKILLDLFAQNPVASPETIKTASEETGLPTKWINSWFVRQRRKARDMVTDMDAINNFKIENQDPGLISTKDDNNSQKLPVKRKARPGRPKKIKTEFMDVENAPLNTISLSAPSPKPFLLPTSSDQSIGPNPELLPSKFILREMIPRMWVPPESHGPQSLEHSIPNPSAANPDVENRSFSQSRSAYRPSQMQVSDVRTVLQPAPYNNMVASHFPPTIHMPEFIPRQSQGGLLDVVRPLVSNSSESTSHQQQGISDIGPELIVDQAQASSNALLPAPSVFKPGIASSSHPVVYPGPIPTDDRSWLLDSAVPLVTDSVPEVAPTLDSPALLLSLSPQAYNSSLDPLITPLKYLTVLEPFERHAGKNGVYATLQEDMVFDRLLDENLARIDPFQAAMGLVFLSRLGLDWEY